MKPNIFGFKANKIVKQLKPSEKIEQNFGFVDYL